MKKKKKKQSDKIAIYLSWYVFLQRTLLDVNLR